MHFGISEGKEVKILKPSVIVYGYFLELPTRQEVENQLVKLFIVYILK